MGRKVIKYNFKFGQFVNVTGKYVRIKGGGSFKYESSLRYWKAEYISSVKCLVIGVRTLKNGLANHSDKEHYTLDQSKAFQCAVVVRGMHTVPFNVPLDCIG